MGIVIAKIAFCNYRQYGTGELHFRTAGESRMSVLIAKNGTGKTTLLNAITWCLYGKEMHLADEKTALPLVNVDAARSRPENTQIPVSVKMTIQDDSDTIEFSRTLNFKTSVSADGSPKYIQGKSKFECAITPSSGFANTTVLQDNDADIEVKKYFDEAIFKFYFFDGEKLRDFFSVKTVDTVKQSIFTISQLTMLENVCAHLDKMRNDRTKKLAKDNPHIEELEAKRQKLEARRENAFSMLQDNQKQLKELADKREGLDEILRSYEPIKKLQTERKDLEYDLEKIEQQDEEYRANKALFIRYYTVLLNLYPRIRHTLDFIQSKETNGDLTPSIDIDVVRRLLDNPDEPCPLCNGAIGESGRTHLKSLLDRSSISSRTSNYLQEIKGPLEHFVDKAHDFRQELEQLLKIGTDIEDRKNHIEKRLGQITKTLSNYDSASGSIDVAELERERIETIRTEANVNQSIGVSQKTIDDCQEQLEQIENDMERALQTENEQKELSRHIEIITRLHHEFRDIKNQIANEMKAEIEKITWDIFESMIWKRQTFGSIKIDDSYNITVYNTDGTEMTGSLSATEQMALAYAFTLAVHIASGKNCPLVIDSPLGRVSDDNRERMAKALLEVSKSKQIIMLFTPDEYSASVRALYDSAAEVRTLSLTADESHIEGLDN